MSNSSTYIYVYVMFLFLGVGNGLTFGPTIILLGSYFEHGRKGLAYAIACSGMGFGIFTIPLVYSYINTFYNFQDAMV